MPKKYNKSRLKKLGLPEPATSTQRKNFAKIQKQWYAKLAKSGFQDLEWVDHNTGKGQNSDYLKQSYAGGKRYHADRALYYDLASNFLTHCAALKGYRKFIWQLHVDGTTYEDIVTRVKRRFRKSKSIYTVFYDIQKLAKICYRWNRMHTEGLLKKRAEDKRQKAESILAEFYTEDYNWIINRAFAASLDQNNNE